jgi:thiol-disulfide isomerase/thioredoxin
MIERDLKTMVIDRRTLLSAGILTMGLGPSLAFAKSAGSKKLVVGAPVPSFKLRDPKTRYVHYLKDMAFPGEPRRKKTKHPVLIDFFRTDCAPCVRSMPELVEVHKQYAARGLKVVLIALHEQTDGKTKLLKYLEQSKLPFLVLEDPTEFAAERYLGKTVSLPATFLVDPNGLLVASKFDAKTSMQAAFGDKIQALLPPAK